MGVRALALCLALRWSAEVKGTEAGPLSVGLGQGDLLLSSLVLGQTRQSLHRVYPLALHELAQ